MFESKKINNEVETSANQKGNHKGKKVGDILKKVNQQNSNSKSEPPRRREKQKALGLKSQIDYLVPSASFRYKRKAKKEVLEHFKHVIKICQNKGLLFQKNLRNTWTAILKTLAAFQIEV